MKPSNTQIRLSSEARTAMIELLQESLATAADLASQCKQAHWSVKGYHFISLHHLFDDLAEEVEGHVDTIAERITALGGVPNGTIRMAAKNSQLEEFPIKLVEGEVCVSLLATRFGILANMMRESIETALASKDQATADLFIEATRALDKNLYFLEAHLR